jgi:hypothetical protein
VTNDDIHKEIATFFLDVAERHGAKVTKAQPTAFRLPPAPAAFVQAWAEIESGMREDAVDAMEHATSISRQIESPHGMLGCR